MHNNKREIRRIIEVLTGIIIILATLSILFSYLFNFEFTSPDHSVEEDINFLADSLLSQKTSALSWLITGSIFAFLLPFYLSLFFPHQRLLHLLNGLIIIIMAVLFFRAGLAGLSISRIMASSNVDLLIYPDNQVLSFIKDTVSLIRAGITAFGLFIVLLSVSRFNKAQFPVFGSILLFLSGPILIFYIWMNPEHLLLTSAIAAGSIGLLIIGARLFTRGLMIKPTQ